MLQPKVQADPSLYSQGVILGELEAQCGGNSKFAAPTLQLPTPCLLQEPEKVVYCYLVSALSYFFTKVAFCQWQP